jgi:hypothetical protein
VKTSFESVLGTKRDVRSAEHDQLNIKRRSKEALTTRLFEIDASPGERMNLGSAQ